MTAATVDRRLGDTIRTATGVVAVAAVIGGATALLGDAFGPAVPVALVGLAAAAALVTRPTAALAAVVAAVVLAEADSQAMLPFRRFVYRSIGGLPVTPLIALVAVAALAAALHLDRRDEPLLAPPRRFFVPLAVITLAIPLGLVTGFVGDANPVDLVNELVALTVLVGFPFVVTGVVARRIGARRAAVAIAFLAAAKIAEGLVSWVLGAGRPLGATTLTFYEPTPLWLLLLFTITALALVLGHGHRSPVAIVAMVAAYATIALSLRRGFWVATAVATALCLLIASGRRGRALVIPAAIVVAVAAVFVIRSGDGTNDARSVALERAQSVAPSRLAADDEDRYRLEEQRNVRAEIARNPLTGNGFAVPWEATTPLPLEHEGGRLYVHFVVLWYWLKLGILGVIGYIALVVAFIRIGATVWRDHVDPLVRAAGLAVALGAIGLAIVEMTASFTGVAPRFTVIVAVAIGWLSAAHGELPDRHRSEASR